MKGRAILWDLDGTIIDPAGSIRAAIDAATHHIGVDPLHADDVLIGMPLREILRKRTHDEDAIESGVEAFRQAYLDETWRMALLYDGIEALLEELAGRVPMGVVTTKGEDEAAEVLRRLGLRRHFRVVVGDNGHRPLKPYPDPVTAAMDKLRAPWSVMVGDTIYDVKAAHAAGAKAVAVKWGHGDERTWRAADAVAADVTELGDILRHWLDA